MRILDIGGVRESVLERADYPPEKVREILQKEKLAVLGYGTQGHAQSLNLRDQGFPVILGLRPEGPSFSRAVADGWQPGVNLFNIPETVAKGSVMFYLLSD